MHNLKEHTECQSSADDDVDGFRWKMLSGVDTAVEVGHTQEIVTASALPLAELMAMLGTCSGLSSGRSPARTMPSSKHFAINTQLVQSSGLPLKVKAKKRR